jgi:hypothetical protein
MGRGSRERSMSDFHAIGGVSATLRTLLLDRLEMPDGMTTVPVTGLKTVNVTIGPPPFTAKDNEPRAEDPQVNLFLYRVTENGYLQNQEIPGRGSPAAYGHPPLSLNLHYLLTAYGNVLVNQETIPPTYDDLDAHFLLGSAMRVLHDVPIITDRIATVRAPSGRIVLDARLRDGYEKVKLSLEPLTLEDITKVWSALVLRYRLSAAYVVNVVQIESRRPRAFPRPVGQPASATIPPLPDAPPGPGPMVFVRTIQTPTITAATVRRAGETAEQPFPYARIGDTLVLRGTSLSGPVTNVAFGDVIVPASFAGSDRVEGTIPDASIPGGGAIPADQRLQPGLHTANVIVRDPLLPQSATTSNDVPFMLVPTVDGSTLAYNGGPPRTLTIGGARLVGPTPEGATIIGRAVIPRWAYVSAAPDQVVVRIPDTLPSRTARATVSAPLADPVAIGAGVQALTIDIGGTSATITAHLPLSVPRDSLAAIVGALIRDALPTDPRFAGARADLWTDGTNARLIVLAGGLADAVSFTSPATFAADLGLTATQPAGAGSAYVSGRLSSPPVISSRDPRITMQVGAQPALTVSVPREISLATFAASLGAAINTAGAAIPSYANAKVATSGSQLVVIPGTPDPITFSASPGDDTTVVELQLHANFAVRVRVGAAESSDGASIELPR